MDVAGVCRLISVMPGLLAVERFTRVEEAHEQMISFQPRRLATAGLLSALTLLGCSGQDPTGNSDSAFDEPSGPPTCDLNPLYLSLTAAPKDGIAALSNPHWVTADHPTDLWFLRDSDRVVGFIVDEQAYAVQLNILRQHEIANATFETASGALDLAITHCPFTGTSMVFDRSPAGGAEFGVSGLLYQSNLIMYDRNTDESLWPQMMGQARCGPAQGTTLPLFASIEMRWDGWVSLYPATRVWGSPPEDRKGYDINPYSGYDAPNSGFTFPMPPINSSLPPKEVVLGVGGQAGPAWAFSFSSLEGLGPMVVIEGSFGVTQAMMVWDRSRRAASAYSRNVGGNLLTFRGGSDDIFDLQTGTRWTVDGLAVEGPLAGSRLDRVEQTYVAYWGAWEAFFPMGRIWGQHLAAGAAP